MAFHLEGAATERQSSSSPVSRLRRLGTTVRSIARDGSEAKRKSPMDSHKIYLLAEITVLPEFLDDVKGEPQASTHSYASRGRL